MILVPIDDVEIKRASRALDALRKRLATDEDPGKPDFSRVCVGCRWGRPTKDEPQEKFDPVRPRWISVGFRMFRSDCGDKYHWTPPHAEAIELGIGES